MRVSRILTACLIFFISLNVFAAGEDDFKQGVQFFKQQKFDKAINAFQKARKKGLNTAALYHNLASSYFKLKKYPQAKTYFQRAARFSSQKMLATYNLGLVAEKQNQPEVAKKHFNFVKRNAKSKKLVKLARFKLGEIKLVEPGLAYNVYAKLSYGHDDNITVVSDAIGSKKSDNYTYYLINGDFYLVGNQVTGIALEGTHSSNDYTNYQQYDFSSTTIGIKGKLEIGEWKNTLGIGFSTSDYEHNDYLDGKRLLVQTKGYISRNNRLRIRYTYDDIESVNTTYYYLTGTRQRLKTEIRNYGNDDTTTFYYQLETNDRTDSAFSYSPTRHTISGYYKYDLTHNLELGGGLRYRVSSFPDVNGANARDDKRTTLKLRLSYDLGKDWTVRGEIENRDNDSSLAAYSYQRTKTSISLIADF